MKKQITKLGFTLIELLVVITIIGIPTGATTVYTSQLQKARDSTRVTSVKALQWAIEQFYSDVSEYPSSKTYGTTTDCNEWDDHNEIDCLKDLGYLRDFPKDPKKGQQAVGSSLIFLYKVNDDWNQVNNQWYEVSSWFEAKASVQSKAAKDSWNDKNRYEVWPAMDEIDTSTNADCTDVNSWDSAQASCGDKQTWKPLVPGSTAADKVIFING